MRYPTKLFLQIWRKLQFVAFLVASPRDLLLQRIKLPHLFLTRIDIHRHANRELGWVPNFLYHLAD